MRQLQTLVMAGLVFGLAACGSKNSGSNDSAPAPTGQPQTLSAADKADLDAKFAQIPQAAIVRVPVDAQGNTSGVPEMHTYSGSEGLASGESAAKAFDAGKAPQKLVASQSELDNDKSTQSWTSWSNYIPVNGQGGYYGNTYSPGYTPVNGQGGNYGNSYAPGYTPVNGQGGYYGNNNYSQYYGGWSTSYWTTTYKPTLYWQGIGWNYGNYKPYNYTSGGYNYYCYRPYKYW